MVGRPWPRLAGERVARNVSESGWAASMRSSRSWCARGAAVWQWGWMRWGAGPSQAPWRWARSCWISAPPVGRLDDSKRLSPSVRGAVAREVRARCSACAVVYVEPHEIDEAGITASLRRAFAEAVASIEDAGVQVDVILLDGNPLGFDGREVNVVKGDAKCASIAAASVIAKTERDHLMERLDVEHPGYGFADNKGYGSAAHIQAIKERGLSTVHRATFCTKLLS